MKPKQQEKTKEATCRATQGNWQQMNRKQRREMTRKIQSEDIRLEVVHCDAAGIDIGNESPQRRGSSAGREAQGTAQEEEWQ